MRPIDTDGMCEVAEAIQGTCKSLDTVLQEVFELEDLTIEEIPIELLHLLDSKVWLCSQCGWWVEPHEVDDDDVCDECRGG